MPTLSAKNGHALMTLVPGSREAKHYEYVKCRNDVYALTLKKLMTHDRSVKIPLHHLGVFPLPFESVAHIQCLTSHYMEIVERWALEHDDLQMSLVQNWLPLAIKVAFCNIERPMLAHAAIELTWMVCRSRNAEIPFITIGEHGGMLGILKRLNARFTIQTVKLTTRMQSEQVRKLYKELKLPIWKNMEMDNEITYEPSDVNLMAFNALRLTPTADDGDCVVDVELRDITSEQAHGEKIVPFVYMPLIQHQNLILAELHLEFVKTYDQNQDVIRSISCVPKQVLFQHHMNQQQVMLGRQESKDWGWLMDIPLGCVSDSGLRW